jgi:type II secretory pathway component HofQ
LEFKIIYKDIQKIDIEFAATNLERKTYDDAKTITTVMECIKSAKRMPGIMMRPTQGYPQKVVVHYKDNTIEVFNLALDNNNSTSIYYKDSDSLTGYEIPETKTKKLRQLMFDTTK